MAAAASVVDDVERVRASSMKVFGWCGEGEG
jgi:hypothetical protein